MSIATDLTRLATAKQTIKTAIEGKGVTVPTTTKLDGYGALIDAIPTGGIPKPEWEQPDDWPRIDLVDPRNDAEDCVAYWLCECVEGALNFGIFVSNSGLFDEVTVSDEGSVTQVEGSEETISGNKTVPLDTSKRYRVFRFRGPTNTVVNNINVSPYTSIAILAIVCKRKGCSVLARLFSYYPVVGVVSGNYFPKIAYVKYVDSNIVLNQNGWRSTNSVKCFVFDNVSITGTAASRNFDTGNNLSKVIFKNGSKICITGAQGPGFFGGNKCLDMDLSAFDFTGATTFSETISSWSNIRELDFTKAIVVKTVDGVEKRCSPTTIASSFSTLIMCRYLDVSPFDFSNVTSASNAFTYMYNLTTLKMPPSSRGLRVSFNISSAVNLTHDSLINVLNSLGEISGGDTKTLTIGSTNLEKLTDDEKAIATNKGWTLA